MRVPILLIITGVVIFVASLGVQSIADTRARVASEVAPRATTHNPYGTLTTVEHDGHLWVLRGASGSSPVHHPDCPCTKKP